jgi:hypothetical protein
MGAPIRSAVIFSFCCSFAALGQDIVWLPSAPKPAQIGPAKTAFAAGNVVAMRDADAARFSGILNVGFPPREPESGASVARHCIAAAKKTGRGQVHLFAGELVKPGRNSKERCQHDFDVWLSSQESLQATEAPNGWTEINNYTARNTSLTGDGYLRTSTLYRANTTDPNQDYFMFIQENSANAAPGSMVVSNLTQLEGTYSAGGASPFDWGPQGVTTSNTFTIGSTVPVQSGSAAFAVSWDGVAGIATNGFKEESNPIAANFQQQTASGSTTLNVPSLLYNAGLIFTVPKGTTTVLGVSTLTSFFQDGSNPSMQYPGAGLFDLRGVAPVLSACAIGPSACQTDLYASPGSTGNSFQINASTYLNWTLSLPNGITTDGPVTEGQGSQTVTYSVDPSAPIGTISTIILDSNPSSAAPSVASGPLQLQVHVTLAPPAAGVLFAGGKDWSGNTLASAEIWDPTTKAVVPTNGPMATARSSHTATVLQNGKIFIAGGFGSNGNALNSTEIFDPATDTFSPGPNMIFAHAQHTASLLQNGTVLVAGGSATTGNFDPTANAELYDPNTNIMSQLAGMNKFRQGAAAVVLNSGDVMVVGGLLSLAPVQIDVYNWGQQNFSLGAALALAASGGQVAVHLPNDQVLVLGSQLAPSSYSGALYTPSSDSFSTTAGRAPNPGLDAAGVALPDGTAVIFAGGKGQPEPPTPPAGLTIGYDPSTQEFTTLPSGTEQRLQPTAALVPGIPAVVVAGGVPAGSGSTMGTAVELFDATQKTWSAAGAMSTARMGMTSTYFTNTSSTTSANQLEGRQK